MINPEFFPVIGLKMTNKCRMKCKFCCEFKQKYPQFNFDDYEKLIRVLFNNGTKRICFTGGEPLLCEFIEEGLQLSHNLGMDNVVFTSDGKKLQELSIPSEYINSLRISIHAIGDKHDEIVQRKGAFKDIEEAIPNLKKRGYSVSINTVLIPDIYDKVEDIIEWCIGVEINKIYLSNLLQSGLGEKFISESGRISNTDFSELVYKLQLKYKDKNLKIISHPYEKNAECILMYGNGDMYIDPCFESETHQKYIGNILKENPKNIFSNFSKSGNIWNDYLIRVSRSTLFDNGIEC